MASNAIAGVGTKFQRATVDVAEVVSIDGPNLSRGTIEVTNLDSTNGYREFIASFRDGGTVNLTMNFTRDTWDDFKDDFDSDSPVSYGIVFPDTGETTFTFDAYVVDLGSSVPFDDKIQSTVGLKIDGQLTMTS